MFVVCEFGVERRVSPSIFGLMYMGNVMLSICSSSCVLYSAGSGVKRVHVLFFFFLKRRFIEINKTIYRIVEKKDIRNTFRVKRNEREESMAAMMIIK